MQLTHVNVNFGSKNIPTVEGPHNRVFTNNNQTPVIRTVEPQKLSAMRMVAALQAQTLTEMPTAALEKMVAGTVSGEAKEWSYISKPEGGDIMSCKLNGKQYSLESIRTDETYEKDGAKYYKMDFALKTQVPGEEAKVFKLTGEQYTEAANKIEPLVMPQIEKMYGLGKGLDLTNVLIDLAVKTVDKDIEWKQVDANIGFGNGLSIEASGAVEGKLPDGTKVHVLEKVKNEIFSITRTSFISLEKPGLPPQVIRVGSDSEEKAYEFFGGAFKLIQKEEELKQGLNEVEDNKTLLKQMIDEFLNPKEPEEPEKTE